MRRLTNAQQTQHNQLIDEATTQLLTIAEVLSNAAILAGPLPPRVRAVLTESISRLRGTRDWWTRHIQQGEHSRIRSSALFAQRQYVGLVDRHLAIVQSMLTLSVQPEPSP